MKNRVVVTGMGALCALGNDPAQIWQGIEANVCGIAPIESFDTTDFKVKLAAEIKDLDMSQWLDKRQQRFNDRYALFARIAAKQAMDDAGLSAEKMDADRLGVLIASGIGGISTIETCQKTLEEKGPGRVSPYFIPMALVNTAAGQTAIDLGAKGYVSTVVSACAAGSNAIGEAVLRIQAGLEDAIVAGGAEASITPLSIAGFQSMRALHTGDDPAHASIPFDADRSGFVMGEGAGVLVLESLEHAQKRGAKIYGEVVGYGASCDANHITAPDSTGQGAAKAMTKALQMAKLEPGQIQYINCHGTSTSLNDKTEAAAIKEAFGSSAYDLVISSTKSNTGHLLGASGAVEAVICMKALEHQMIPATINVQNQDPQIDLDICANENRQAKLDYVMSNSLGFGGHNISLIFAGKDHVCS